jgi:hypothetical protein
MLGTEFFPKPSVPGFSTAVDHEDLRRKTVPFLRQRTASGLLRVVPSPPGRLDIYMASRRLATGLPWRLFLVIRLQLQHPPSAADLSVPPRCHTNSGRHGPLHEQTIF